MGLKEQVQRQLKLAFRTIGNLAKDVTFTKGSTSGFDFNALTASTTTDTPKVIKGVVILEEDEKQSTGLPNAFQAKVIVDATTLDDPSIYSKLEFDGNEWTIVPPHKNDGFTITLKVVRSK